MVKKLFNLIKPEVKTIKRDCANCQFSYQIYNIQVMCERFPQRVVKWNSDFCYEHQFDPKKHISKNQEVKS